jgi:hypothetical protein
MSGKKKAKAQPRPVTAWFYLDSGGKIAPLAVSSTKRARSIRCRVTPLRKPTNDEIELLAERLYEESRKPAEETLGIVSVAWAENTVDVRQRWRLFARTAWKRGAR